MTPTTDLTSTSTTTARSHHATPSGGSPVLRSAPIINPATAHIVIPDIILNSPPDSRRGSHVSALAEAAANVGGVLHGLGLSVATLPSLAQFKWAADARRKKESEDDYYAGRGRRYGYEGQDEEADLEDRQSRSTSPKYILPSYIPNQPYPLSHSHSHSHSHASGSNADGLSPAHAHLAAESVSPTSGPKSKKKYKGSGSKYAKHRAHWGRRQSYGSVSDEDEGGMWAIIFMMVMAVMALAYLSSMLSGGGGEYAMAGLGEDKVLGGGMGVWVGQEMAC